MELLKSKKKGIWICVFLGPSVIGFLMFFLIPFILGIYYSLVDNVFATKFVGISNYISLFKSSSFQQAGINTLIFTGICVPLNMGIALALAMLLNNNLYYRNIFRTFFVTPLVVPVASVVLFWRILFDSDGWLNYLLASNNLTGIDWLNSKWAIVCVIIAYLWKNIGYSMILLIAGLQNIPVQFYESSYIDGANWWQKFTKITMVYLTPTTFFVFIMAIINSFKVFREIYLMAGDYPHKSIYMLQHFMNNMFTNLDYQKLTSGAFIMALVIYFCVLILFGFERKISKSIS